MLYSAGIDLHRRNWSIFLRPMSLIGIVMIKVSGKNFVYMFCTDDRVLSIAYEKTTFFLRFPWIKREILKLGGGADLPRERHRRQYGLFKHLF